jgi:hypothetical protein
MLIVFAVLACAIPSVIAQDYVMFETQYIKVQPGRWQEFSDKMAAHNKQFHSEGPFTARVWRVSTGAHSGQVSWVMGPCTFTDLDNRPSGDPHNTDWLNNVMANAVEGIHNEYWRGISDLSYVPNQDQDPLLRIRFVDVAAGEAYRFRQMMSNIKEVLAKKNYPNPRTVYENQFSTTSGREWAIVTSFDKWADLDRDNDFPKDYEEVHGDGSWALFMEEVEEVVDSSEIEMRELLPELSAPSSGSAN